MGRTDGKLIPFFKEGLETGCFENLKWENIDSHIFSLDLPRYGKGRDFKEYEKILYKWHMKNNRVYPGYSPAKAVIQAALRKSVYLVSLSPVGSKLRFKFANEAEIEEKRNKQRRQHLDRQDKDSYMKFVNLESNFYELSLSPLSSPNPPQTGYENGCEEDLIEKSNNGENMLFVENSSIEESVHILTQDLMNYNQPNEGYVREVKKEFNFCESDLMLSSSSPSPGYQNGYEDLPPFEKSNIKEVLQSVLESSIEESDYLISDKFLKYLDGDNKIENDMMVSNSAVIPETENNVSENGKIKNIEKVFSSEAVVKNTEKDISMETFCNIEKPCPISMDDVRFNDMKLTQFSNEVQDIKNPVEELTVTEVYFPDFLKTYWLCTTKINIDPSLLLLICEKKLISHENINISPGCIYPSDVLKPGEMYYMKEMVEVGGKYFLFLSSKK